MLDDRDRAESRLIAEVTKLAPRFAARAIKEDERNGGLSRIAMSARPYLISVILVQAALAFTEWEQPFIRDGTPALFAFSVAVLGATRLFGILPGLFSAIATIVTVKLFFIPPFFEVAIAAGASKFCGISVGVIAIAMARPTSFDNHARRRLRRINEAIRNTRSSSTALPRFSSLIRNS